MADLNNNVSGSLFPGVFVGKEVTDMRQLMNKYDPNI